MLGLTWVKLVEYCLYKIMPCNHIWQVGVVVMTSACHAGDPSSIPCQGNDLFLWYLYVYCTSIIWFHVLVHQYASPHLTKYHWCSGINTCLPSGRVFKPHKGLTFVIFCWNCPNFKGKNNPLPTEGFWKKLTKTIYK